MSGRRSCAVVKDFLTTQTRSGREATVKKSLTVQIEGIRRRFAAGRRNLEQAYRSAVDSCAEFDNFGEEPTLLQWKEKS